MQPDTAAWGGIGLMSRVTAWGVLEWGEINATVPRIVTYVGGIDDWSNWGRFDGVGWGEVGWDEIGWDGVGWGGVCCIDVCYWGAGIGCEIWKGGGCCCDADWFWWDFLGGDEVDCFVCWDGDGCIDGMKTSEIIEKNSIVLKICCGNAAKNAVKNVAKDAVENDVKNADDLEIPENAEIDVNENVKSAAEKICWLSRNFQYFFTAFSLARWSAHNVLFGNCNFELRTKLSHVSFFGHLMKFFFNSMLHSVFAINVFVFFSTQTFRCFKKSRSSRIFAFVVSLKSFSM